MMIGTFRTGAKKTLYGPPVVPGAAKRYTFTVIHDGVPLGTTPPPPVPLPFPHRTACSATSTTPRPPIGSGSRWPPVPSSQSRCPDPSLRSSRPSACWTRLASSRVSRGMTLKSSMRPSLGSSMLTRGIPLWRTVKAYPFLRGYTRKRIEQKVRGGMETFSLAHPIPYHQA